MTFRMPASGERKPRDDFEQMSRVGGRPHAAGQNQIVARSFTVFSLVFGPAGRTLSGNLLMAAPGYGLNHACVDGGDE